MRESELARLRHEYALRKQRLIHSRRYTRDNLAHRFALDHRCQATASLLAHHGISSLSSYRVLELGCGGGTVLAEITSMGAMGHNIHGVDLLLERVRDALALCPGLPLVCADGQSLPYRSGYFDLLLQYTVFTSILDDVIKINLAAEMLRVLRPDGLIIWYDFWLNPTNRQTRGIQPTEIRRLFPGCHFDFRRITLAPPLARIVAPVSWTLAALLERLVIFNSHYLVAIRKSMSAGA